MDLNCYCIINLLWITYFLIPPTSCWFRHSKLSEPQGSRRSLTSWASHVVFFPPHFIQQTPANLHDLISSVLSRRKLAMTPSMGEGSLSSYSTRSHPVITHFTQCFKFLPPGYPTRPVRTALLIVLFSAPQHNHWHSESTFACSITPFQSHLAVFQVFFFLWFPVLFIGSASVFRDAKQSHF